MESKKLKRAKKTPNNAQAKRMNGDWKEN